MYFFNISNRIFLHFQYQAGSSRHSEDILGKNTVNLFAKNTFLVRRLRLRKHYLIR